LSDAHRGRGGVSIAGEDILAGRLRSHRSRGGESATFSYQESYLVLEEAYELDLPSRTGDRLDHKHGISILER
jgi:hypothetical protein